MGERSPENFRIFVITKDILASQLPVRLLKIVEPIAPVLVNQADVDRSPGIDVASIRAHALRTPLLGEIGCALAHRQVYEVMTRDEIDFALVLEADARVGEGLAEDLCKIWTLLAEAGEIPHVVTLYTHAAHVTGMRHEMATALNFAPWHTSAYCINKAGARALLSAQTPLRFLADWPVESSIRFTLYRTMNVAMQPGKSSVDPGNNRQNINLRNTAKLWSHLWLAQNRHVFGSCSNYWFFMVRPRLRFALYRILQGIGHRVAH